MFRPGVHAAPGADATWHPPLLPGGIKIRRGMENFC